MDNRVINPLDGAASLDAAARRRRMHRRQAKRRLTRVAVVAAGVFTAAAMLAPDRPLSVATSGATSSAFDAASGIRTPLRGPLRAPAVGAKPSALTALMQPLWRPAADVLKRKTTTPSIFAPGSLAPMVASTTIPFGLDSQEVERRESLGRWHRIYTFSTQYRIKPDLARRIFDAAITAGIEPELAFRLVRVESVFNPQAASPVGAVGLTQLMVGTAREFEPNVTREQLMDPDVNLRIGFKYLRTLIREYKGNLKIALLVYNRGPAAVHSAISMGVDPANGYESMIMRGYRGRGILD